MNQILLRRLLFTFATTLLQDAKQNDDDGKMFGTMLHFHRYFYDPIYVSLVSKQDELNTRLRKRRDATDDDEK